MKYRFEGIGGLSATLMFTALAASPVSFLTNGFLGKFTYWVLKQMSMYFANKGLMFLNVGVAHIQTLSEQAKFDGSLEEAIKQVIKGKERLTPDEKKQIDDKVISSFTAFAHFGSVRDGRVTES